MLRGQNDSVGCKADIKSAFAMILERLNIVMKNSERARELVRASKESLIGGTEPCCKSEDVDGNMSFYDICLAMIAKIDGNIDSICGDASKLVL